ncbi:MAG: PAS domain-containing protein, partial [Desulfovibrionales bacterium]|nr:PAS domain-containing protein [Desulfovibrionales bacterium]
MTASTPACSLSADILASLKEHGYQEIFMHAPIGIFMATPEGYFAVNPAMALMLGYASAQEMQELVCDIPTQIFAHPKEFFT